MAIIEINNSFSLIKDITPTIFNNLRKTLSYHTDPQAAFFSGNYRSTIKYMIDSKGQFPTGLLELVKKDLLKQRVTYTCVDHRNAPTSLLGLFKLNLGELTPYAEQVKAINLSVAAKRGTISAVTGYGKSIMMAMLIDKLQLKTLIVVPNLSLKQQLKATFQECFGTLRHITIENIDSKNLKKSNDYDVLILDEVHHAAARTYQKLHKTAWSTIYHRYGFTATPYRNQEHEQLLFRAIAGEIIHEIPYKKAVKDKAIVPVEAYYYDLPKRSADAYTWAAVYNQLVVNNSYRNELIAALLLRLNAQGKATLCLVKEIAHGEALSSLTSIPFTNGQDETSRDYIRQFNSGGIKTIIGTNGVIGEGIDTKPCEYVVIAGLGKAKSAFCQQVGRGVRKFPGKESCKIIIFRDTSHKWMKSHFNTQAKILFDEYGVKPVKLEV